MKIKIGDTVQLLDHPLQDDPNHLAVVRKIFENEDIMVTNVNMPFIGTYSWKNGLIKNGKYSLC